MIFYVVSKYKIFLICYIFVSLLIILFLCVLLNKNKGNYCYIDLYDNLGFSSVCKDNKCDNNGNFIYIKKFRKVEK